MNSKNSQLNAGYNRVLKIADNTQGGDYVDQRKLIRDITGVPQSVKDNFEKDYKTFYQTEKLVTWDNKQGALDPLGKFDGKWY